MNKINIYIIILLLSVFFYGCQACPSPVQVYLQGKNPAHDNREDTSMTLHSDWQAIKGEIMQGKDTISYKVAVLPEDRNSTGISLAVCYNNKKLTPLTGDFFPLEIIAFNTDGDDKSYRNKAGEEKIVFDFSNISYLLFSVYTVPEYTSGKYEICFKK